MNQSSSNLVVSVVAPLHNDGPIVTEFVDEVIAVLASQFQNYELILIDDGSTDNTHEFVSGILERYSCIRIIKLSQRYGDEIAIASGLDTAIGDVVVVMTPTSTPPSLIPEFVEECTTSEVVVVGIRRSRQKDPLWLRVGAYCFHFIAKRIFKIPITPNTTCFWVLPRPAVNAITRVKDKHRHLNLQISQLGFTKKEMPYEQIQRTPTQRYKTPQDALEVAIDLIVSHSVHPLRVVTWLGLLAGTFNALYVIYICLVYLTKDGVAEGWTTLSLQNSVMFFFVFLILVVMAEYLGRILRESTNRPLYHVISEKTSSLQNSDDNRRNVVVTQVPKDQDDQE